MDRVGADYRRAMDTVKLKLGGSNPIVLQHHLFRRGSSETFLVMKGSSKRLLIIFQTKERIIQPQHPHIAEIEVAKTKKDKKKEKKATKAAKKARKEAKRQRIK